MALLSRQRSRSRMVIFRLTQAEYESLKSNCIAANGRSISEYMRSELLTRSQLDPIDAKFGEIDRKLTALEELVRGVSERIGNGRRSSAAVVGREA